MPYGESEDLLIQVGNVVFPCDFVILDMVDDPYTPLILGKDALKTMGNLIDCESETITVRVAKEKVVFGFAKSSKEPMVEQLCTLKVVENMLKEKGEGHDVLIAPVFDGENFDDKVMKKNVCVEKEKDIVVVRDDNDHDVEDADKQSRKRKQVRKRKCHKEKKMASP